MIEKLAEDMSMTTRIRNNAKICYHQINKKHKKKTKKDELLAAVCIAIACRQSSVSRSFKELAQRCSNVTRKELGRAFKTYTRLLTNVNTHFKMEEMVPRYASRLGMDGRDQLFCEYIVKQVSSHDIVPASCSNWNDHDARSNHFSLLLCHRDGILFRAWQEQSV